MMKVPRLQVSRAIEQGDLNPVGMIVAADLTPAQFQSLNGSSWVVCDGASCSGSKYANVTGQTLVPDLRGRVVAGVDNMGGSAANRLTSAASGVNGQVPRSVGGSEVHALSVGQMPSHGHGVNDAGHGHNYSIAGISGFPPGSAGMYVPRSDIANNQVWSTHGSLSNISIQNNGSGVTHQNTQPTIVLNYFIKIN